MFKKMTLAAVAAVMSVTWSGIASAQEFTWKFAWASPDSETDPNGITGREFKKAVEELSKGRIQVDLYPNRQLGDEKAMLEGLRFGTIESATVTSSSLAQIQPTFQVADLPFLFPSTEVAHEVLDGPVGEKIVGDLESKGIKFIGFMELGFRHMVNNVRPVRVPEDVVGVKYRVMQNPLFIAMFDSLGGNAVPMAWGEMFGALQQGAIDGMEAPLGIIDAAKLYEMGKYLSLTYHTYSAGGVLVSKKAFDKLPEDLQAVVVEAGKVTVAAERAETGRLNVSVLDSLKSHGMEVNEIEDSKPFRDALLQVYKDAEATAGKELVDELLAAVESH